MGLYGKRIITFSGMVNLRCRGTSRWPGNTELKPVPRSHRLSPALAVTRGDEGKRETRWPRGVDPEWEWTQNEKTRERQAAPRERGARPKRRWEHGQLHFRCQYTSRDLNYCIISINNSFSYLYILKKYTEMWVKIYLYKDVPFGGFYNNKTQQKLNTQTKESI